MAVLVLVAGMIWACLIGWLILRATRQFQAHRTASLRRADSGALAASRSTVAIIVPARNEAANIGKCLGGLAAQRGTAGLSITVVDDSSHDATAEEVRLAALTDARIVLLDARPLPPGWMGKPHACWRAAAHAQADWLCFVDADVRAEPELMATAVATAERGGIDMLSLAPFQELGSFWERLIIPAGLVLIACAKDLRLIDDPASSEVSANGQFILIRRAVYLAVGGHAAVRGKICEDKALAANVKLAGHRFRLLGAERLARTRMYTDLRSLWEGFAKNAVEIMGDAAATIAAATAGLAIAWAAVLLPGIAVGDLVQQPSPLAAIGCALALVGSLAATGVMVGTARHFRIPAVYGLLFPFGYAAVAALAWRSVRVRRNGRVSWKGRTYELLRKA
jgi:chlorobactene glucosyltransferase